MYNSYIAIGDSFTEGVGDERPDGTPRGWADRLAEALALDRLAKLSPASSGQGPAPTADESVPFRYANLAIRGRKLTPIIEEQVGPAIDQRPDLISFNAGGNDMLRPKFEPGVSIGAIVQAVERIRDAGISVLVLAGPDPVNNLPLGRVFSARGKEYTRLCQQVLSDLDGVTFVDNFNDRAFEDSTYWSDDGLHLAAAGHLRVAANCLDALDVQYPATWADPRSPEANPKNYRTPQYFGRYVAPWIGRRLTGRSSGDGRAAKRPLLEEFGD